MNIIFQIDGGLGKSIMATAVIEALKKSYPDDKIIIITAYPDVFLCNPNVFKTYSHDNLAYFYKDHILGKEYKVFLHNPYSETSYINKSKHLIETWIEMFGMQYEGETTKLYLTDREVEFYSKQFISEKPIMVVQTNGGAQQQPNKYSWARDIPHATAQKVIDTFKDQYQIFHIRREDQPALQNTVPVHSNFRSIAVLVQLSEKRLFMDSFAQHTASALGKNSVVCWIANSPKQFGHPANTNILANAESVLPELKNSVFSAYNIVGDPLEFPFKSQDEIFNAEDIINALNSN
jgi:ADP-heptose:LPS heptosyltransferase